MNGMKCASSVIVQKMRSEVTKIYLKSFVEEFRDLSKLKISKCHKMQEREHASKTFACLDLSKWDT